MTPTRGRFPDEAALYERRRIVLLVLLSIVGNIALILFSVIAFLQNNLTLSILNALTALILTINLVDARRRKDFIQNIKIGIFFITGLYIYLYVSGGTGGNAFVWYFTYPLLACYLLGSLHGGILSGIMLVPVIALVINNPSQGVFAKYELDFVVRFILRSQTLKDFDRVLHTGLR